MTSIFGFADECRNKLNKGAYESVCLTFTKLPIAAVVDDRIFCVHGGLAPEVPNFDAIMAIDRFDEIPETGPLSDLTWSDPDHTVQEWGPSERGPTVVWGLGPLSRFLSDNRLEMIVRAHQVVPNGFDFPFGADHRVVTVFTASCSPDDYTNRAAFMSVEPGEEPTFTILPNAGPEAKTTSRRAPPKGIEPYRPPQRKNKKRSRSTW
jgi:serine/threonine-protein phosphatase PP1 catalytic subunit